MYEISSGYMSRGARGHSWVNYCPRELFILDATGKVSFIVRPATTRLYRTVSQWDELCHVMANGRKIKKNKK